METTRLTISVEEAGRVLGISRSAAYSAVHAGQIPCLRIGKRMLVPRIPFEKMLGKEAPNDSNRAS